MAGQQALCAAQQISYKNVSNMLQGSPQPGVSLRDLAERIDKSSGAFLDALREPFKLLRDGLPDGEWMDAFGTVEAFDLLCGRNRANCTLAKTTVKCSTGE